MLYRARPLVMAVVVLLVGCKDDVTSPPPAASELSPWSSMPAYAWRLLRNADSMEWVTLDPDERPSFEHDHEDYGGWKVLGRKHVVEPTAKAALANAVAEAVNDSDGSIGKCFHPRHGVKVRHKEMGNTELVICFACATMRVNDVGGTRWVSISSDERPVFDALYEAQGLTIKP